MFVTVLLFGPWPLGCVNWHLCHTGCITHCWIASPLASHWMHHKLYIMPEAWCITLRRAMSHGACCMLHPPTDICITQDASCWMCHRLLGCITPYVTQCITHCILLSSLQTGPTVRWSCGCRSCTRPDTRPQTEAVGMQGGQCHAGCVLCCVPLSWSSAVELCEKCSCMFTTPGEHLLQH